MLLFSRQSIFEFLRDSLFFAVDNEGMEHTDAEHIRNGIERQIREPKLYREESSTIKPEKAIVRYLCLMLPLPFSILTRACRDTRANSRICSTSMTCLSGLAI